MYCFNASFEIALNSLKKKNKNQIGHIKPGPISKAAKDSVPEHRGGEKRSTQSPNKTYIHICRISSDFISNAYC